MLIDFWTYTCINCIRTLPYLTSWDAEYRDDGLTDRRRALAGVRLREGRRTTSPTRSADYGIGYPVVQDNDLGTWNAFANQYWPAKYLIDAEGHVRYVHFGEGDYEQTERGDPLAAAPRPATRGSAARPSPRARSRSPTATCGRPRPTSAPRGPRAGSTARSPAASDYGAAGCRARSTSTSSPTAAPGPIDDEAATAGRERGDRRSASRRGGSSSSSARPTGRARSEVLLDGEPIPADVAGEDVENGAATIDEQRLYRLVDLPKAGRAHARAAIRRRHRGLRVHVRLSAPRRAQAGYSAPWRAQTWRRCDASTSAGATATSAPGRSSTTRGSSWSCGPSFRTRAPTGPSTASPPTCVAFSSRGSGSPSRPRS